MSYARFGWGGSDVYVYLDVGGYLCCCACALNEPATEWKEGDPLFPPSERLYSTAAMFAHLDQHRAAGHTVLDETYEELGLEAHENDVWIAEEQRKKAAAG